MKGRGLVVTCIYGLRNEKKYHWPNLSLSMTLFCLKSLDTRLFAGVNFWKDDKTKIDKPVILHNFTLAQLSQEIFIMGDDYQLEVGMILAFVDDTDRERG